MVVTVRFQPDCAGAHKACFVEEVLRFSSNCMAERKIKYITSIIIIIMTIVINFLKWFLHGLYRLNKIWCSSQ